MGSKYPLLSYLPQNRGMLLPSAPMAVPIARLTGTSKALAVRLQFCEPEKGCHRCSRSSRFWSVLLGKIFSWAHELAEPLKEQ